MAGTIALCSANIGVFLNCLVLLGLTHFLKSGKSWLFLIMVILASAIKPFYLQFFLFYVFVAGLDVKAVVQGGAIFLIAVLIYFMSYVAEPHAFMDWIGSLNDQSNVKGVSGLNVYTFIRVHGGLSEVASLVLQLLFSLVLVLIAFLSRTRSLAHNLALATVVSVFANPRLMMYDVFLAAIPTFYLLQHYLVQAMRLESRFAAVLALAGGFGFGLLSLRGHEVLPRELAFPLLALLAVLAGWLTMRTERAAWAASGAPPVSVR